MVRVEARPVALEQQAKVSRVVARHVMHPTVKEKVLVMEMDKRWAAKMMMRNQNLKIKG